VIFVETDGVCSVCTDHDHVRGPGTCEARYLVLRLIASVIAHCSIYKLPTSVRLCLNTLVWKPESRRVYVVVILAKR